MAATSDITRSFARRLASCVKAAIDEYNPSDRCERLDEILRRRLDEQGLTVFLPLVSDKAFRWPRVPSWAEDVLKDDIEGLSASLAGCTCPECRG